MDKKRRGRIDRVVRERERKKKLLCIVVVVGGGGVVSGAAVGCNNISEMAKGLLP